MSTILNSKDPYLDLFQQGKSLAAAYFGLDMLKNLGLKAGKKFFEDDIPVKVIYVDRWPATRAKVKEMGLAFWLRRVEGAAAAGLASSALLATWSLSSQNALFKFLWDKMTYITEPFVMGSSNVGEHNAMVTAASLIFLPAILGVSTTLYLGSSDLIKKSFNPDQALEIKPIFNNDLQSELDAIVTCTRGLKHAHGYFQNLLLYGPPGTGKTMISKWIARNSEMNYILMSAGDLFKMSAVSSAGAQEAALKALIDHAKSLTSPTVIFIDEADSMCKNRDQLKNPSLQNLLNTFLEQTSQASSKVMFILATNRPQDIDPAVLSRMDYKLFIDNPKMEERRKIIKANIKIIFANGKDPFPDAIVTQIAEQTEKFSGRDLFKLLNRIKGATTMGKKIDRQNIDAIIQSLKKQDERLAKFEKSQKNPTSSWMRYLMKPFC